MLACFSKGFGLASPTKKRKTAKSAVGSYDDSPTPEEEEKVYNQLAPLSESLPTRHQALVEEVLLGGGANGIAYLGAQNQSVAVEADVFVFFQGQLSSFEGESPAYDILHKYNTVAWNSDEGATSSSAAEKFGELDGSFAVVIFDRYSGRIVAARDQAGAENLFWGTAAFGEMLLFSTSRELMEADCADADAFPAGTFFCSELGDITGDLAVLAGGASEERAAAADTDAGCAKTMARVTSASHGLSELNRVGSQPELTTAA